ncbi:MAG: adenylate/guanylate cyclase domain-containing protein [Terriglobales bacterium]
MDIDGWLRGIGLEQYAQTFRDNAIDADVLRDLTDEHLRELGVPLGARLKLLRAIAALSAGEQTPASPEVTPPAARTDAERRQVTVMFSDLVGSTALSARMDPEDLREVISAYQKCVAEAVKRFGGFVAKSALRQAPRKRCRGEATLYRHGSYSVAIGGIADLPPKRAMRYRSPTMAQLCRRDSIPPLAKDWE